MEGMGMFLNDKLGPSINPISWKGTATTSINDTLSTVIHAMTETFVNLSSTPLCRIKILKFIAIICAVYAYIELDIV